MKVLASGLKDHIKHRLHLPEGDFYFFDHFVIAEINEGVTYDWSLAEKMIFEASEFYGSGVQISYISNRINSYSIVPGDWLKLYQEFDRNIVSVSLVSYTHSTLKNFLIEKLFIRGRVKHFRNLLEAVQWTIQEHQLLSGNMSDRAQLMSAR